MNWRWPRLSELRIAVPIALPVLVMSVFVLRGCSTASVPLLHPPEGVTLPAAAATSAPADLTGVQLAAVNGTTTLQPARASGTAHLFGSVNGPQGPAPGATVRVEHLVDDDPPPIDVLTGPDGRWDLPNIAGGRYRVRSFLAPSLAQTQPEIFFLVDGEQRNLDLNVENFVGASLAAAVAPDPPQLNEPATLVVRVARKSVDGNGVVSGTPIANAGVVLTGTPGWAVRGSSSTVTDGNGDATFTLECRSGGASQVEVAVRPTPTDAPQTATLDVAPCSDPTPPPTAPPTTASGSSGPPPTASAPPPN
jgi:hypothetical protein